LELLFLPQQGTSFHILLLLLAPSRSYRPALN
jgi:hypothetical protein